MGGIRALERTDLTAVCDLFARFIGGDRATLARYFEQVLFADPWADADIPSLVYEGPEGIVGFIGASTRRLRVDGRPLRMAVSSNMVVHPDWRPRGIGALLLRKLMSGPQDVTLADRSNDDSRRMWIELGGQELVHASVGWYRLLRPGATAASLVERRRTGRLADAVRLGGRGLDAVTARLPKVGTTLTPPAPAGTSEPLTLEMLLEQMSSIGRRIRLHPDYDAEWLRWTFGRLEELSTQGHVVARLVHDTRARVAGWYVLQLREGGAAQVLQVGVPGNDVDTVLDHLFHQAWRDGAAVVQGRLEPPVSGLLSRPGVVVRRSARALVASQDSTVLALLGSTKSLLSHLDGEYMVSHALRV